jgi:AcrR family transcriptional regulator
VIATAASVFESKGYDGASLEDIAQAVGITKGTLYHYIGSKEELLFAVVQPPAERLLQEVRQLADEDLPASERIRRITHTHAGIVRDFGTYVAVYLNEVAGKAEYRDWAEKDREYINTVEHIIEKGIADGDFSPHVDPHVATMTLIGALNWLLRWYDPSGPRTVHQLADEIADVVLGGLLTRMGRPDPRARDHAAVDGSLQ